MTASPITGPITAPRPVALAAVPARRRTGAAASSHAAAPHRLSWATAALAGLAAALPGTVLGLRITPDLLGRGLLNPDSAMRLVRLHDILAAGHPLAAVMRDGSGAGSVMSWSHLLDSLLLLLAAPLAALVGWDTALHLAGLAFGPLGLVALGVAIAWAAAPVARPGWLWLGAFAAGVAPAIRAYGALGVVHHHTLLTVCAVMSAGWALRLLREPAAAPAIEGAIALGAWTGAGLWLSPEALPFSLMALGAVWVAWLVAPGRRLGAVLLAASLTTLAVSAAAWWVDPPAGGLWVAEPDRLSLPFTLLAGGAAATALLAWLPWPRLVVLGFGAAAAGLWLAAFPQVLHGTSGLMPPDQAAAFFGPIREMQPVHGLNDALTELLGGLLASGALLAMAWRTRSPVLLYAFACSLGMLGLAALHVRFSSYPQAAGGVALPIVLTWISDSRWAPSCQSLARLAIILPVLATPVLLPLSAEAREQADADSHACKLDGAVALLASHPGAVVLAGVNLTPDLLYRTQVLTVGSLYHRNPQNFMRLRAAWRSVPGDAPSAAFRATRATLVLACPGGGRSALVENLPHTTLLDRLLENRPPAWLHRVADAGPGGFVLYAAAP